MPATIEDPKVLDEIGEAIEKGEGDNGKKRICDNQSVIFNTYISTSSIFSEDGTKTGRNTDLTDFLYQHA